MIVFVIIIFFKSFVVQKYAAQGGPEFFFIVNIQVDLVFCMCFILFFLLLLWINHNQIIYGDQVPGSTTYSLALYYVMKTPVADAPLLESFIKGDDAYRNSRFKLIPYISKVSIVPRD